jgi:hypothetical protein
MLSSDHRNGVKSSAKVQEIAFQRSTYPEYMPPPPPVFCAFGARFVPSAIGMRFRGSEKFGGAQIFGRLDEPMVHTKNDQLPCPVHNKVTFHTGFQALSQR